MLSPRLARYRNLLIISSVFLILLIIYLFFNARLATVPLAIIKGERIYAAHLAETIIWLVAWVLITMAVDVFIWQGIVFRRTGNPIPRLLKSSVNLVLLLLIVIFIVATVYHKEITGLVATTGALGIVIGLSLRGVIENAAQGIALNIERPFKTGDYITIPGKIDELAIVRDITYRNTYIEDTNGRMIAIPNSVICSNVVRNYSRNNSKLLSVAFDVVLGVRDMSTHDVIRVINAVLKQHDFIVNDPPPQVYISSVKSYDVTYQVSLWVLRSKIDLNTATHVLNEQIIEQLSAAGFSVGHPYIDHDGIQQQIATVLREVDTFEKLATEDKSAFFQQEMLSKRAFRVLRQVALFSELTEAEFTVLSQRMSTVTIKAEDYIIHQGEDGDSMYIVVEGTLQVYINSPDGKELIPVAKLVAPQYFGEMSLLIGDKRSATIVALSDVELYQITRDTMGVVFEAHPDLIEKISQKIAEQRMQNLQKMHEYSSKEAVVEKQKFVQAFVGKIKNFFMKK